MDFLLENGLVLSATRPYKFKRANILISDGKIKKISEYKITSSNAEKIDCSKKAIVPGFLNVHTHSPMSILRGIGEDKNLFEWLNYYIWPVEKKLSKEDVYWGTLLSISEMIRSGTTCFNEHYFFIDSIAKAVLKAKIRCVLGYSMIDMGDFKDKGQKELEQAQKDLELVLSYKSPLLKPSINPHAPNTCSKELLLNSAKLAEEYNCILHTHLAETKTEILSVRKKYRVSPTMLLKKSNCLSKRAVLAHCIYCSDEDIKIISTTNSTIVHCPVANFKLGSGSFCPVTKFLKQKVKIALGTDGPASNNSLNILESAKFAALIQKNFYMQPDIIKADDVLYMLTEGGAKALYFNSGSILEGKLADLVFFDLTNPTLVPFSNNAGWLIYCNSSSSISDVMVNGEFVMKDRTILTFDESQVINKANSIKEKFIKIG